MDRNDIQGIGEYFDNQQRIKKYKTLQIESDIADEFKQLAKENRVTQTQLLNYLMKSTRELQEIKKGK